MAFYAQPLSASLWLLLLLTAQGFVPTTSKASTPNGVEEDGAEECAQGCPFHEKAPPTCDEIKKYVANDGCASDCSMIKKAIAVALCGVTELNSVLGDLTSSASGTSTTTTTTLPQPLPMASNASTPKGVEKEGAKECAQGCPFHEKAPPTCDEMKKYVADDGCASDCSKVKKAIAVALCGVTELDSALNDLTSSAPGTGKRFLGAARELGACPDSNCCVNNRRYLAPAKCTSCKGSHCRCVITFAYKFACDR